MASHLESAHTAFDTNKGEDRLTGAPITWMGQVIGYFGLGDAAYVEAQFKRGSTRVWSGFLDGSGCTPSLSGRADLRTRTTCTNISCR